MEHFAVLVKSIGLAVDFLDFCHCQVAAGISIVPMLVTVIVALRVYILIGDGLEPARGHPALVL